MTVTPDTVVVGVEPDISPEKFVEVLVDAESPAAQTARGGYQEVVRNNVSPAFALAIFKHESRFGHVGLVPKYNLKNPGATRSSRNNKGEAVHIPGRGQFWRYPQWVAGWDDLALRLVDPEYVYVQQDAKTIREIIQIWAPASDGNVPESYIAAVVKSMNEWISGAMMPAQIEVPGIEVEWYVWEDEDGNKHVGADNAHHTPGRTHAIRQIVHHHTDGWDSRDWLTHTSPNNVSSHFLVNHEGDKIWQLVALEDTAHTQGTHNPWSVGIEWERKWPDQTKVSEKVYDTLAKLDVAIMNYVNAHNLGEILPNREYIKRHDEVNNTGCPKNLDVDRIVDEMRLDSGDDAIHFDTGYKLQHGFADFYRSVGDDAWRTIGVPIGSEIAEVMNGESLVTVQQTDVGWLQWTPGTDEIRMATRNQQKAIEQDLGISKEINLTREKARAMGEQLVTFGNELRGA